jgi:hypothetical protein
MQEPQQGKAGEWIQAEGKERREDSPLRKDRQTEGRREEEGGREREDGNGGGVGTQMICRPPQKRVRGPQL